MSRISPPWTEYGAFRRADHFKVKGQGEGHFQGENSGTYIGESGAMATP